jgi:isopenicillin N synthase-like dioxygenase
MGSSTVLPCASHGNGALGASRIEENALPIVDLAPLLHGSPGERARVAEEIGTAAREFGFLYIRNHGIDQRLIDRSYAQAGAFFGLEEEIKLQSDIARSSNHRGYVPVTERGLYTDELGERHYEAFDSALELPSSDPAARAHYLLGPNVWPKVPGFRATITAYYRAAAALGRELCRAFELYLQLPAGYFDPFMTRPTSQLRLLHYIENLAPMTPDDMNMGAHTDYECFTILHQTAPGLQVLGRDGRWIEAPPVEGTFVMNIGDMLEIWTNGIFRSNVHRVVNNGRERFSMPFFMAANYDAVIRPVDSPLVRRGPSRYLPTVAGHHLMGQLLRDFGYLRARYDAGVLDLGFDVPDGNPFESTKHELLREAA